MHVTSSNTCTYRGTHPRLFFVKVAPNFTFVSIVLTFTYISSPTRSVKSFALARTLQHNMLNHHLARRHLAEASPSPRWNSQVRLLSRRWWSRKVVSSLPTSSTASTRIFRGSYQLLPMVFRVHTSEHRIVFPAGLLERISLPIPHRLV